MGDFINFLFDRYDRSVVVLSLSWSGGDRARKFVRVLIGPRLMGDFINFLFDRYDRPS